MALQEALDLYKQFGNDDRLVLMTYGDSAYVRNCMTREYGGGDDKYSKAWVRPKDRHVVNKDLIWEACRLHAQLEERGSILYTYVPTEENAEVRQSCDEMLDYACKQEQLSQRGPTYYAFGGPPVYVPVFPVQM